MQSRRDTLSAAPGQALVTRTHDTARHGSIASVAFYFVAALATAYAAYFSAYTCILHGLYGTHAYDLGTFDQGIWLAGHEREYFVTVRGLHLLGDHVRFLSFVLAPLYYVWDDVRALLVLQSVVIAAGALLLYLIARRAMPDRPILTGVVCASYLLNPAVQNLNLDHAHPDAFASTLITGAIYCVRTGRTAAFWLCAVLAMSCKEDVPLVFTAMGVLLAALPGRALPDFSPARVRRFGVVLAAVSATYFVLCLAVILPHFNGVGFFRVQGGGFFAGLPSNVRDPSWLAERLLDPANAYYLFALGSPLAFTFLLAPLWLFPALPALAANLLSNASYPRNLQYHYQTSLIPFMYTATIDVLARLPAVRRRLHVPFDERKLAALAGCVLLATAVAANQAYSRVQFSEMATVRILYSTLQTDRAIQRINAVLAEVPGDAVVSADYTLVPHLSHRRAIYMFPNPFRADQWAITGMPAHDPEIVEYIVRRSRIGGETADALINKLTAEGIYTRVAGDETVALYRRILRSSPGPGASCGDWNGDGVVANEDVKAIVKALTKRNACPPHVCDANGDGRLNTSDVQTLLRMHDASGGGLNCPVRPLQDQGASSETQSAETPHAGSK